jgi:hypothetical protein
MYDDSNKQNGNGQLANQKPTPIHCTSQVRGSVVIVYGEHQNH